MEMRWDEVKKVKIRDEMEMKKEMTRDEKRDEKEMRSNVQSVSLSEKQLVSQNKYLSH